MYGHAGGFNKSPGQKIGIARVLAVQVRAVKNRKYPSKIPHSGLKAPILFIFRL
jgi:hypothetical protein